MSELLFLIRKRQAIDVVARGKSALRAQAQPADIDVTGWRSPAPPTLDKSAISNRGNGKPKHTQQESSADSTYRLHSPIRTRAQSDDGERGNADHALSILRHSSD